MKKSTENGAVHGGTLKKKKKKRERRTGIAANEIV